ncbi:(2Fe-2S)-binding protein [Lysinibacillus sp. 54212]|uniref:(2Fe-2S)-binding protein n=1 Tax=Lysinibacillus sp. 54212 TaxID=3119829 RepID=UPI002FC8EAD1
MNKVLVCRCEGVCLDEILVAIKEGATSVQGIKMRNRVGMGYCQGRTCQPVLRDILIEEIGVNSVEQVQKAQSPVRPILFGEL